MAIAENIAHIHDRMTAAARRTGRDHSQISLMAVSKTYPAERIHEAYECGVRLFGENRVQEFTEKVGALSSLTDASFHLIGHLQSNKAAKATELFSAVDSVDSLRLAQKLNAAAGQLGKKLQILIEINVGGEAVKSGLPPQSPELEAFLTTAPELSNLEVRGLMTIPPFTEDSQQARPYFRKLRELRDGIGTRSFPSIRMDVLSMGMSHDFEIAIEEGSTCVRVGTAIFGQRTSS